MKPSNLQPLEFTECLSDSPHFRKNLLCHEKGLDRTSQQIEQLIKDVKAVVKASTRLKETHKNLWENMKKLELAGIGASRTEDERVMERSLHDVGKIILTVEEERERMLSQAHEKIILTLEEFRKVHIGAVKRIKKNFGIKTANFCKSQEHTLSLSTKSTKADLQEGDAARDLAERDFYKISLLYVSQLQVVQERKKFLVVETLQKFMSNLWAFHYKEQEYFQLGQLLLDLQPRIERTKNIFDVMTKNIDSLVKKMTKIKKNEAIEESAEGVSQSGYVFLMKKKASGNTWSKQFCTYEKNSRTLTLTPYNQITGQEGQPESVVVEKAQLKTDSQRRFCWKVLVQERPPLTLQAPNERKLYSWLQALSSTTELTPVASHWPLNKAGFEFVKRLTTELEARGLNNPDLYKLEGVESEVSQLMALGRTRRLPPDFNTWKLNTLTSALKSYLHALPDPLLTHHLHDKFLSVAKKEQAAERVSCLRQLVGALPPVNSAMLRLVLTHLERMLAQQNSNVITPSDLALFFGPTLLEARRTKNAAAVLAPSHPASLNGPTPEIPGNSVSSHAPYSNLATALDASATSDTAPDHSGAPAAATAEPLSCALNEHTGYSMSTHLSPASLLALPAENRGIQDHEIPGVHVPYQAPPRTPATTRDSAAAPPLQQRDVFFRDDENTSPSGFDAEQFPGPTLSGDGNADWSSSSSAAIKHGHLKRAGQQDEHSKRQCVPKETHQEEICHPDFYGYK